LGMGVAWMGTVGKVSWVWADARDGASASAAQHIRRTVLPADVRIAPRLFACCVTTPDPFIASAPSHHLVTAEIGG
jgi:hypothetical protein